jgi:hypothetical protein
VRSATRQKIGKDPEYLEYIRSLPCCVCAWLESETLRLLQIRDSVQKTPTEAAHVGPRGLSQKCPDRETLPLCAQHHREGQFSQHSMGKRFWSHFDLDREELLAMYQAHYRGESVLDAPEVFA